MVLMNPSVHDRIRASLQQTVQGGMVTATFRAMGTNCRLIFGAPPRLATGFVDSAIRWVADFEARYSRFLPDSLTCEINRQAGKNWVGVDQETERLLACCQEAHFLTRGVFDPTALPLIELWNWKADPPVVPTEEAVATALSRVGWRKVQRAPGRVFLPEPGMAEYAVDQVVLLAARHGLAGALVDFGQDVFAFGQPPDGRPAWKIGLENPHEPGRVWAALAIQNRAVATSGDYLRQFTCAGRRYGHILDVRTGRPVENPLRAVSVIAPNCTIAGLLATAAFVLGPEEGLNLIDNFFQAEGCLVTDTGRIPSRRFYEHVTK
jgi:thiamine biosynthesis lipoprotein